MEWERWLLTMVIAQHAGMIVVPDSLISDSFKEKRFWQLQTIIEWNPDRGIIYRASYRQVMLLWHVVFLFSDDCLHGF